MEPSFPTGEGGCAATIIFLLACSLYGQLSITVRVVGYDGGWMATGQSNNYDHVLVNSDICIILDGRSYK